MSPVNTNLICFVYFRVMVNDPFHANCLPVHIGTLVELSKANGNVYNDRKILGQIPNTSGIHCVVY